MVKAPEKFLEEYLSRHRQFGGKTAPKPLREYGRNFTDAELVKLKHNVDMLWGIYTTPEIKEILSKKGTIHFLTIETATTSMTLSYAHSGIFMEYELDIGVKKELAGARIYKQAETLINRYFSSDKGMEELLKTTNGALQTLADKLTDRELSETEIWDVILKGDHIHLSNI